MVGVKVAGIFAVMVVESTPLMVGVMHAPEKQYPVVQTLASGRGLLVQALPPDAMTHWSVVQGLLSSQSAVVAHACAFAENATRTKSATISSPHLFSIRENREKGY
jgi:hypothetical protein